MPRLHSAGWLVAELAALKHVDGVASDPDVQLLESFFQFFFEGGEEFFGFFGVFDIDEHANQLVAVGLSQMRPCSLNGLRLRRNGAEPLAKLEQRLSDQLVGNRVAVIELEREKNLETPQ